MNPRVLVVATPAAPGARRELAGIVEQKLIRAERVNDPRRSGDQRRVATFVPIELGFASLVFHRYRAGTRQDRHAHEASTLSIVLAGSIRERLGRVDEVARPFSVVVSRPASSTRPSSARPARARCRSPSGPTPRPRRS